MNKALLLVAHGSRRQQSNDEIRVLTRKLAVRPTLFAAIGCAFLELAEPSIPEGIARFAVEDMHHIVVLPYFLSDGRHVHEDIPAQVAIAREAHPQVTIEISPYIGASPSMPDLLLSTVTARSPRAAS